MKRGIAPLIKRTVSYNFNYFLDSMNSIGTIYPLTAFFQNARRVSGNHCVGGDIFGDHATGADDSAFADGEAAEDCGVGAERSFIFNDRGNDLPVGFGLQAAAWR